ncbi:helix-turn-helix domain-containing protein [Nocardioides sp. URHA0020]|uniref:helix-turn-helix domain-containing protein n=1 Tax=Nocardioides sp. URHA0020 TaxID=1380392 RepID=UPI000685EB71|nr:LuxR C-terminal-related transcriptional regulator [Nocardioides sp. URHA0020]
MVEPGRTTTAHGWEPSPDDVRLLRLLSEGHTTDAVARREGVSERTIRRRLRTIADEIGVDSTIEAVVYAVRARVI